MNQKTHLSSRRISMSSDCDSEIAKILKQQAAVELPSFDGEYINLLYFYNAYQVSENSFSYVQNKNRVMKAIVDVKENT